jgi:hypothetical protein
MRKLNLEIIPRGSLNHIAVEATLKDSIVMAQQHDEGVKIIKQMLCDSSSICKLGTLFVSVKYMLVSVKLVCVYMKLLKKT